MFDLSLVARGGRLIIKRNTVSFPVSAKPQRLIKGRVHVIIAKHLKPNTPNHTMAQNQIP